jgi:hypothetical protein
LWIQGAGYRGCGVLAVRGAGRRLSWVRGAGCWGCGALAVAGVGRWLLGVLTMVRADVCDMCAQDDGGPWRAGRGADTGVT